MKSVDINVDWQAFEPPHRATSWVDPRGESPSEEADDRGIEDSLGWPHGTIAQLRSGFAKGLTRSQGWQVSSDATDIAACQVASSVYKRGVDWADRGENGETKTGRYPVRIIAGDSLQDVIAGALSSDVFCLVDRNVSEAWDFATHLPAAHPWLLTERSKSLESVGKILQQWRGQNKPKQWWVLGGGILSDVASFAASLVGAEVHLVPTTLLSMVDASVGGKTGVNFPPYGKNQVGRFYFPQQVLIWSHWCKTLSARHWRGGGCEALKHMLLAGDTRGMEAVAQCLRDRDLAGLAQWMGPLVQLKADVVSEDPSERGRRASLNLGHTLGHALESVAHARLDEEKAITHGEAVGVGLAFAIHLSQLHGGLSREAAQSMTVHLRESGCLLSARACAEAIGFDDLSDAALWPLLRQAIAHDKKAQGDAEVTHWVLLRDWGKVAGDDRNYLTEVSTEALASGWTSFLDGFA